MAGADIKRLSYIILWLFGGGVSRSTYGLLSAAIKTLNYFRINYILSGSIAR